MTSNLMDAICDADNIASAVRAVVRNKGAPGVDGITVRQLPGVLQARWPEIEHQLLQGRYQPQPVRRVQIPKPAGGTRDLGIPTVIDRAIQQAALQRLQPLWDPTFSEHSYGFRPGRSAHQAVAPAQAYVAHGYRIVVDIDLAKFLETASYYPPANEVRLNMADCRVITLIRSPFLLPAHDVDRFEFAALDTLQHGLARKPQVRMASRMEPRSRPWPHR